jgi:hypothetical protein
MLSCEVPFMHSEERFQLVQKRAYEIYQHRDPAFGTAEEDWWNAEREIEREEQLGAPERKELSRWNDLVSRKDQGITRPT